MNAELLNDVQAMFPFYYIRGSHSTDKVFVYERESDFTEDTAFAICIVVDEYHSGVKSYRSWSSCSHTWTREHPYINRDLNIAVKTVIATAGL